MHLIFSHFIFIAYIHLLLNPLKELTMSFWKFLTIVISPTSVLGWFRPPDEGRLVAVENWPLICWSACASRACSHLHPVLASGAAVMASIMNIYWRKNMNLGQAATKLRELEEEEGTLRVNAKAIRELGGKLEWNGEEVESRASLGLVMGNGEEIAGRRERKKE